MDDLRVNSGRERSDKLNKPKKKSGLARFIVVEDDNDGEDIIDDNKVNRRNTNKKKKAPRKPRTKAEIERTKRLKERSTYTLKLSIKCVAYALLVVVIYIGCMKAYTFGSSIFDESGMEAEGRDVVVTIPTGASVREIAVILKENGLIKDETVFMIQAKLYDGEFYSGTYTLNTSYGPEEIIEILSTIETEKK